MLRLQKFDLQVSYKKGTETYLAGTLSRAYRVRIDTTQVGAEDVLSIENIRGNTERELESINMIQYLPVSEATQTAIREARDADATLRQLKTIIRQGWPASKEEVSEYVRDYFSFREELLIQNGRVSKGERLVISASMRDNMLAKIHASHIGIQGC